MSIYLLLYFIVAFTMIFVGYKIFKKYGKNIYGKYFFASTISYFIWIILYLISFTKTYDKDILLTLSRLMYGTFLLGMYFMLFSIASIKSKKSFFKYNIIILPIIISFFLLSVFTKFIIKDMVYSDSLKIYYEDFGIGYLLYSILYLIFPILFVLISYFRINKLNTINKVRFKYISLGFLIFIINEVIFLAILPLFNIWIFQKEQILFFLPFIILTWYSITRYHFTDIRVKLGKIFVYMLSFFGAILFINILKYYYLSLGRQFSDFWGVSSDFGAIDLILGITLFVLIHRLLNKIFLGSTKNQQFSEEIDKLKQKIPFITNIEDLNNYIIQEFKNLFKIKYVNIYIFKKKDENSPMYRYFSKSLLNDLFINDIVFIEENKHKFNKKKIKDEVHKKVFLILPIHNNYGDLIGTFSLGKKPFKDFYFTEDIDNLKEFVSFLEGHLKYINTYSKLEGLNLNLDKKVDEKTIEYNNLMNRQKEFISLISHEVKGPLATSIFQCDCILDDIEEHNYDKKSLVKEINILNEQLLKSGKLIDKLFDVQLYDIKEIKLYKEKINIGDLISSEVKAYERMNKNIDFNIDIDSNIGFVSIDKIQFTQVIDNLLTNAVKFSQKRDNIINIKCFIKEKHIFIEVEDSGKGFDEIDIKNVFNKYSTGNIGGTGLGMGLFLCKRIVELHNGTIKASSSKKLGGAKFIIKLNKN